MLRILHLGRPEIVWARTILADHGIQTEIEAVSTKEAFLSSLIPKKVDLILASGDLPDLNRFEALKVCQNKSPETAVIFLYPTAPAGTEADRALKAGVLACVNVQEPWRLVE